MCKSACYDLLNTHLATMQVAEHTRMQIYEAIADHFSNKQLLPLDFAREHTGPPSNTRR